MENFFEKIVEIKKSGEPAALAIIIRTEGSTPRKPGTKMIIMKDGKTIGTMGGGDLENRIIQDAIDSVSGRENQGLPLSHWILRR